MRVRFIEISNFRRLHRVRLEFATDTTLLVGANNSGKTAVLHALQIFLRSSSKGNSQPEFSAYDVGIPSWTTLNALGENWEALEDGAGRDDGCWQQELEELLGAMPALDIWLDVADGEFHRVRHLLPNLSWRGGLLGIRLRLEPASDVEALRDLASDYQQARRRTQSPEDAPGQSIAPAGMWPCSLTDYWARRPRKLGRAVGYRLDPGREEDLTDRHLAQPQALVSGAIALPSGALDDLIRINFVAAQRGLGSEEASTGARTGDAGAVRGVFSKQLVQYCRELLGENAPDDSHHHQLYGVIAASNKQLDAALEATLKDPLKRVKELGYPGLSDPRIELRSQVRADQLLNHDAGVQYVLPGGRSNNFHLPEHAIGLGFQNLLSLSFRLLGFQAKRLNPPKNPHTKQAALPAPIHLVLLEEPEAHLHVQVQRLFIEKAHGLVRPPDAVDAALTTQLLVSTHSSHIAQSLSFRHIRFFRRLAKDAAMPHPTSAIVGLAEVFGGDAPTRRFVERYLRLEHSDLFFADAAILIEGAAERMLLPEFIRREFPDLAKRYITTLTIGGSHAHRLKPLLETLGLTTLIITDLDPTGEESGTANRTAWKAQPVGRDTGQQAAQRTSNVTLKDWLPGLRPIGDLLGANSGQKESSLGRWNGAKIRVAYQLPATEGEACGSSFEDALVLENRDWFAARKDSAATGLKRMANAVAASSSDQDLAQSLFDELRKKSFGKAEFALDILFDPPDGPAQGSQDPGPERQREPLVCPQYIREGLNWLSQQFPPEIDADQGIEPEEEVAQ